MNDNKLLLNIDEEKKNRLIKAAREYTARVKLDYEPQKNFIRFMKNNHFKLIDEIISIFSGNDDYYPSIDFRLNNGAYRLMFCAKGIRLLEFKSNELLYSLSDTRIISKDIFLKLVPNSVYFIDMLEIK